MLKLYYLPGACSLVPHTALEWIGVDFDAQAVDHTVIKSPEYLALNPNGQVPLLQEGSWTLTQNVAILDYLNDVYPQAKLYGSGDARAVARAREWLAFLNADLHKAFSLIFGAARFSEDESVQNAVRQAAGAQALTLLARADRARLSDRRAHHCRCVSVCDFALGACAQARFERHERIAGLFRAHRSRCRCAGRAQAARFAVIGLNT